MARPRSNSRRRSGDRRQRLSGVLMDVHSRTRSRVRDANRPRQTRASRNCKYEAIAETSTEAIESLPGLSRLFRWALALLLFPLCIVTTVTLFQRVSDPDFFGPFWRSTEFWYFATGFIVMCAWFFTKVCHDTLLYLYVLGHELTHVIFVYLSLGKVADIKVTRQGGYIITNKSNVLIALSPYFVPFWTSIVILISFIVSRIVTVPHHEEILFLAIGITWGFHLLWTLWMIPRDQPDLKENDTLFSLVVIYLANILVVAALVCLATDRTTLVTFTEAWSHNFLAFIEQAKAFLRSPAS